MRSPDEASAVRLSRESAPELPPRQEIGGERDPLRDYLDLLASSLDSPQTGVDLARRAHLSRFHFTHVVSQAAGESPVRLRRRILLERAAWELRATARSVTDAAFDAGYDTVGGFSRAFRQHYGVAPSVYRHGSIPHTLAAPNGIHYQPPAALRVGDRSARAAGPGLLGRLLDHDTWLTRRILLAALELPREELFVRAVVDGYECRPLTLADLIEVMIAAREQWPRGMDGKAAPESILPAVDGWLTRWDQASDHLDATVYAVNERQGWSEAIAMDRADAGGPVTLGAAMARLLTVASCRRAPALQFLQARGLVQELGWGDPVDFEAHLLEGGA